MMYVNNQDISDYEYTDIPYAEKFDISMDAYPQTIDINNNTAYTIKMNDTDVSPGGTYTTGDNVDIQGVIDGTSSGAVVYNFDSTNEREVAYASGQILSTYLNGTLIISGSGTWSDGDYNISVSGGTCILESTGAVYIGGQLVLVYMVV